MQLSVFGVGFITLATLDTVLASAGSCHACVGPTWDCISNNRTDFLKMDCNTFKVEGESLSSRTSNLNLLEKFDNEVGARRENSNTGCLTLVYTNHEQDEIAVKSCVPDAVFDRDICDYMKSLVEVVGGKEAQCDFCEEDDCNSTTSFSHVKPFVLFVLVLCFYV